jgi:hypothetical protein
VPSSADAIVIPARKDVASIEEAARGHEREHHRRAGARTSGALAALGHGHPPPAPPRLPAALELDHRHGRRQPAHRRRRPQADLRHHRFLGMGRRGRPGRSRAPDRVRAVGRGDRRHHGPAQAPADHQQRHRRHLAAVLASGLRRPGVGGRAHAPARRAAGLLGPERAGPQRLHRPAGPRGRTARSGRPRLDRDADRPGGRSSARRRPHPRHRPARAVPHRRAGPVRDGVGGVPAAVAATPGRRGGAARGREGIAAGFRYISGHTVLLLSFLADIIAMVLGMPRASRSWPPRPTPRTAKGSRWACCSRRSPSAPCSAGCSRAPSPGPGAMAGW